jgi:orotate phosphoribosyltransferase
VLIALDRCERTGADDALSTLSAVAAFERAFGIPVITVARLDDLLQFIDSDAPAAAAVRPHRQAMLDYRRRYGA